MSANIDERIVKMEFDNKRFEKNVKTSLSTLDKLKKALKMDDASKSLKALEKQANSINFNKLDKTLDTLNKRFSTFGVASTEVIKRLTNAAINAGKTIDNAIFGQIRSGGWRRASNLEQARFQLQGILKDANKVEGILNGPVMNAVDGTAYGMDQAAKTASVLVASGLKDLDELGDALLGVSGAAAMTGREYEDIGNIFATVASNGKLMTMQLRQFSAMGLNVAATLAEALGVTEAEINDMVTKGEISFEQFSVAMNEAFGEHAKDANETFAGSLSNVKARLSQIGEAFASPAIKSGVVVFNDLRNILTDVRDLIKKEVVPVYEKWLNGLTNAAHLALLNVKNLHLFKHAFDSLKNVIKYLIPYFKAFDQAVSNVVPKASIRNIYNLITAFEKWTKQLRGNMRAFKAVYSLTFGFMRMLSAILKLIKSIGQVVATLFQNLLGFDTVFDILTAIGNAFSTIALYIELFIGTIDYTVHNLDLLFEAIDMVTNGLLSSIKEKFDSIKEFFKQFIPETLTIGDVIKAVAKSAVVGFGLIFYGVLLVANGVLKVVQLAIGLVSMLEEPIAFLVDKILIAKDAVLMFVDSVAQNGLLVSLIGVFIAIGNRITDFAKNTIGAFGKVIKSVKPFAIIIETINKGLNKIIGTLARFVLSFGRTRKVVNETRYGAKELAVQVKDFSKTTEDAQEHISLLSKVGQILSNALDMLGNAFRKVAKEITPARIYMVMFIGVVSALTIGIFEVMHNSAMLIRSMRKLVDIGLIKSFKKIGSLIDAVTTRIKPVKKFSASVREFAEAIALLTACVYVLSKMPVDELKKASIVLGGLSAGLLVLVGVTMALSVLLKKLKAGANFAVLAKSLIGLSASVALLTGALYLLSKIENTDQLIEKSKALGIIILAFGVAATLMGKFAPQLSKGSGSLLVFALSIGILVKSLNAILELNLGATTEEVMKSLLKIMAILFDVAILAVALSKVSAGTGFGIALIVASLLILQKVDWSKLQDAVHMFESVMGNLSVAFTVAFGTLGVISIFNKEFLKQIVQISKAFKSFASGFRNVVISIGLIVGVIYMISKISDTDMDRGVAFIAKMMLIFAGLMVLAKFTKDSSMKSFGVGMIALSAAIFLLVGAIAILGSLNSRQLTRGTFAVSALLSVFGVLMACSKLAQKIKFGTLIGICAMLITITGSLVTLSMRPWQSVLTSVLAIDLVMIALAGVFTTIAFMSKKLKENSAESIKIIASLLIALAGIGGTLYILSQRPWQNMIGAAGAVSACLIAFGATFAVVSKVSKKAKMSLDVVGVIGMTVVALIAVGSALALLANKPWKGMLSAGISIAVCLAAFGFVFAVVGKIGPMAEKGLPWAGKIVLAIVALATVFAFVGWLVEYLETEVFKFKVADKIAKIGEIFEALGEAFGKLIGGVLGGINETTLKPIGEGLTSFMDSAKGFFKSVNKNVNKNTATAVRSLADIFVAMTSATHGISPSDFESFATGMETLGNGLAGFADSEAGKISPEDLESVRIAAEAIKIMAEAAAAIPGEGGFEQALSGFTSLEDFASQMKVAGRAIYSMLYGDVEGEWAEGALLGFDGLKNLTDADFAIITNVAECIKAMAEAADLIPNGGDASGENINLAAVFLGQNDLVTFAQQMGLAAPKIAAFINAIPDELGSAPSTMFSKCMNCCAIIAELAKAAKNIPKMKTTTWNVLGHSGSTSSGKLSTFLENLKDAAPNLKEFIDGIATIEIPQNLGTVLNAIGRIVSWSKTLANIDYVPGDIEAFGIDLNNFIPKFASFIDDTKTVKPDENLDVYIAAFRKVRNAFRNIEVPSDDVKDFYTAVEAFGRNWYLFCHNITESNMDNIDTLIEKVGQIKTMVNDLVGIDTSGLDAVMESVQNIALENVTNIEDAAKNAVDAVIDELDACVPDFKTVGENLLEGFKEGLRDLTKLSEIKDVANNIGLQAKTGVQYQGDQLLSYKFKEIGVNCVNGFALGLADNDAIKAVAEAAKAVGDKAKTSTADAVKVQSPSKVFAELGMYTVAGYAVGINDNLNMASDAATQMGNVFEDQFRDRMGIHSASVVTKLLGKFTASGFYVGLKSKWDEIREAANKTASTFMDSFKSFLGDPKKTVKDAVTDAADGLFDGLEGIDVGSAGVDVGNSIGSAVGSGVGSGISEGVSNALTAEELTKALIEFAGVFGTDPGFDKFNKALIKKGKESGKVFVTSFANSGKDVGKVTGINLYKATAEYLTKSFSSPELRRAAPMFADNLAKKINDEAAKSIAKYRAKNNKKLIDYLSRQAVKQVENTYSDFQSRLKKISKGVNDVISQIPEAVGTYIKNTKDVSEYASKAVSAFTKTYSKSLKKAGIKNTTATAKATISTFARKLYEQSDEYKQTVENLKNYRVEYKQVTEELKKQFAIMNDMSRSDDDRRDALNSYNSLLEQEKSLKQSINEETKNLATGDKRAWKEYKASLKDVVKDYLSISNISFDPILSSMSKFEKTTNLTLSNVEKRFDAFSLNISKTISFTARQIEQRWDAFSKDFGKTLVGISTSFDADAGKIEDGVNNIASSFTMFESSIDTGIDKFSQFEKIAEVSPKKLMKAYKSQLKALSEFQEGIEKMQAMGFNESLVSQLASEGPQALGKIKGFLRMSASEVAQYNSMIDQESLYAAKSLERNMEEQINTYDKFQKGVAQLQGKGYSEAVKNYIKNGGMSNAKTLQYLLKADKKTIGKINQNVADMISRSASDEEIMKALNKDAEAVSTSWYDSLQKEFDKKKKFNDDLVKLQKAGVDSDIIDYFKEQGYEASEKMVEEMIKSIGDPKKIAEYNRRYKQLAYETNGTWLDAMKKGNKEYDDFELKLDKLKKAGLDKDVIDHLRSLGVDGSKQYIEELMKNINNKKALNEYNEQYKKSAGYSATAWLDGMNDAIQTNKNFKNNLETLRKAGISEDLIKYLKEQGAEGSKEMMDELLANVKKPGYVKKYNDSWKTLGEQNSTSWLQAMKNANADYTAFEGKLSKLKKAGLSQDIIDHLREMGVEGSEEILAELMKNIGSKSKIKEYNAQYAKSLKNAKTNPLDIWAQNIASQNNAYETFNKYMKQIANKAGKNSDVYKTISAMGYEEGYEYAQAYIEGDKASQNKIKELLANRRKANQAYYKQQMDQRQADLKQANNRYKELAKAGLTGATADYIRGLVESGDFEGLNNFYNMFTDKNNKFNKSAFKKWMNQYNKDVEDLSNTISTNLANTSAAVDTEIFTGKGKEVVKKITKGVNDKTENDNLKSAAKASGKKVVKGMDDGISDKTLKSGLEKSTKKLPKATIAAAEAGFGTTKKGKADYSKMTGIGKNAVKGVTSGLEKATDKNSKEGKELRSKSSKIADIIIKETKNKLKIKSPSKVMQKLGMYTIKGFSKGIEDNTPSIEAQMNDSIRALLSALNGELDFNPVITPQLDISRAISEAQALNSAMNKQIELKAKFAELSNQNGAESDKKVAFYQYNYSPKALNRLEIYRQTRNQFAQAAGKVSGR